MATKTRRKSSIDNTRLFKALLTAVAAIKDRPIDIEDIVVPAGVEKRDVAALKQRFKLWSDPTIVIRTKDQETGEVTERQNKPLPQRRDFVNFMRAYLASHKARTDETVVSEMCDKAYAKLRPTLELLGASTRSGIKLDSELGGLMDDLLGDDLFDDDENVVEMSADEFDDNDE